MKTIDRIWWANAALAAAYAIAARLGLLLALPNTNASPIWFPAGLAMGAILRWGADGRITFLNESGLRFFGYSAEEIIGRHVVGTLVPTASGEGPDLEQLMARICANPEAFEQNVNENMLRDGRRVWISWTNRVVRDEQGRLQGILSVGTDVTERRKADEAIRVLNADLERRVAERTAELGARNQDLERFNRLFVDRELRMKELKQRLKELEGREPHRP